MKAASARSIAAFSLAVAAWAGSHNACAFDLQGHRGARGLAPENTLAAFDRALAVGVTTLELDVGLSRDGVLVVAHDPLLNPALARHRGGPDAGRWLAGERPRIADLAAAELQAGWDVGRLDPASAYARGFPLQVPADGQATPTLAEVFALAVERGAGTVRFNIEPKTNPLRPQDTAPPEAFARALLDALRAAGVEHRSTIQSFDWRVLRLVRDAAPHIERAYLTSPSTLRDPAWADGLRRGDFASTAELVRAAGGRIWSPSHADLTAPQVREAQALGIAVLPWTVNEPADIERLLDWGVDGLISDYPDSVRAALAARGRPVPQPAGAAAPQRAGG